MKTLMGVEIAGKRVLVREDLNVAIKGGKIVDDTRIRAALPTIKQLQAQGAQVIVMSHLGRPTEGRFDPAYSLTLVAQALSTYLNQTVPCIAYDTWDIPFQAGQVVLLENTRFYKGEKANDDALAKQFSTLCDVFVMDAFATAHRAQASTEGVARFAPVAVAGPLLVKEIESLENVFKTPKNPLVAIVGGAKLSPKFGVLKGLLEHVDTIIVGGGIANTLLGALGYTVGKSLYEPDYAQPFKDLLASANAQGKHIPVPVDVRVAKAFSESEKAVVKSIDAVAADDMILDIGPATERLYADIIAHAGTVIWNGPLGVFEWPEFASGTTALAHAIASSKAYSLAGGGETIAAINQTGIAKEIDYISTGGGAFLTYLEGKPLPALDSLIC